MDKEFQTVSYQLIDKFKRGEMTVVISELTELELKDAPQKVQNVLLEIPERFIEYVDLTEEAVSLAKKYIKKSALRH